MSASLLSTCIRPRLPFTLMSIRIVRPLGVGRKQLSHLRSNRTCLPITSACLPHTLAQQIQPIQRQNRTFTSTPIVKYEMSQGSHPHLKIAELFDVSGLTVAVTVSTRTLALYSSLISRLTFILASIASDYFDLLWLQYRVQAPGSV